MTFAISFTAGVLLLVILHQTKFADFDVRGIPPPSDLGLLAIACAALEFSPLALRALLALALALLFSALWLDALLWRCFTIELGPGGVKDVVASQLYSELTGLASGRRFFSENRAFTALPAAAAAAFTAALLHGAAQLALCALFAAWAIACMRRKGLALGVGVLKPFLFGRRLRTDAVPRAEHAALLLPRTPTRVRSEHHGLLRGSDVLLLTIESAARDHLRTRWFESLKPKSIASANHFCICPLTNDAHVALYASDYVPNGYAPSQAFREAGYRLVYVTAANTTHYGLKGILDAAGFELIQLESDAQLPDAAERLGEGPKLVHVHTSTTHLPYTVCDPARFHAHDASDDFGRYLNGLDEADALLEAFAQGARLNDPLLIVSADHGQAFANSLGYRSHGSAIVRDELLVPMLLHHPKLPPRTLPWSTHFDLLPTALDLLGVESLAAHGQSMLAEREPPLFFVSAGHPSRTQTSNYGFVHGEAKYMVDRVLERAHVMGWNDDNARLLDGAESGYIERLASAALRARGLR